MQITHIPKMEPMQSKLAPSGAYLMVAAIKAGHKRLEMYGFDSMAGEFHSESTIDYRGGADQEVEKQQGESFLYWYNKIMQENTDIEFIWHTNE